MKRSLLPLLFGLICFNTHAACQDPPSADLTYFSRTLRLETQEPAKAFYFRAREYAILVERRALIGLLERRFEEGQHRRDGQILAELRAVADAGQRYVDLFAIVLIEPFNLARIELLLGSMLESGQATVVNALSFPEEKARIVPEVVLYKVSGSHAYSAREFCTDSGELLLQIVDSIA